MDIFHGKTLLSIFGNYSPLTSLQRLRKPSPFRSLGLNYFVETGCARTFEWVLLYPKLPNIDSGKALALSGKGLFMARLFFRYSAMNAGKSTYLLQVAHNYNENGSQVLLFTSAKDDRAGVGVIASRIGLQREAATYTPETNFFEALAGADVACVLVDEAQFLTFEQAQQLHQWVHKQNIPVICFGIRSDFRGLPFPGSAALLALADDLEEIKTICKCGKRATMNIRTDENGERVREGEQVLIGGNSRYRQVCAKCFYS